MPITLGCPSCGKRFRARDESAGKRVKCPYCAAAVSVPTPEEAANAAAPTMALPTSPTTTPPPKSAGGSGSVPISPERTPAPAPASVAPADWGVGSPPAPAAPDRNPFGGDATAPSPPPPAAPLPMPAKPVKKPAARPAARAAMSGEGKTPEQLAAPGWRKARAGLFWVQFALLLLSIPGFVGFGKAVYARAVGPLPQGEGWVKIPGYVNDDNAPGAVRMNKPEQLDIAIYAGPVILAGLFLGFGRLTCGAVPRSTGSKGMFAFSGLFTLVALAALMTAGASDKLLLKETYRYAALAFLLTAGVAEFWFLVGLAASGVSLKRPRAARAVGLVGFVFALTAAIPTLGWIIYVQQLRPKTPDDDWRLYEQAGVMMGWLLLIGVYWRAVRNVRIAIRDFLETVEE